MPPAGDLIGAPASLIANPAVKWIGAVSGNTSNWLERLGSFSTAGSTRARASVVDITSLFDFCVPKMVRVNHLEGNSPSRSNWECGFDAKAWFDDIGIAEMTEAYFHYFLFWPTGGGYTSFKFESPSSFGSNTHSGKLPGIAGMNGSSMDFPGGGSCTTETNDGWSVRGMYAEYANQPTRGRPGDYVYAGKSMNDAVGGTCSSENHGTNYKSSSQYWAHNTLSYHVIGVKLNPTPGNRVGGWHRVWARNITMNGYGTPQLIVDRPDVMFRPSSAPNALINILILSSFPGGPYKPPGDHLMGMFFIADELIDPPTPDDEPGGGDPPPDPEPEDPPDPFPAADHYRAYEPGGRLYVPGGRTFEPGGRVIVPGGRF